jgi:glutamyl/glutaminyl-tRNA synthetase
MSKRKILYLISNGHVRDWDDPRLYTLIALRRRGVPPGAILSFVSTLGVSKAPTTIDVKRFEQCVRAYLEVTVPRLMVILDPVRIVIDNLPADYLEMVQVPFAKDPEFGVRPSLLSLLCELYSCMLIQSVTSCPIHQKRLHRQIRLPPNSQQRFLPPHTRHGGWAAQSPLPYHRDQL